MRRDLLGVVTGLRGVARGYTLGCTEGEGRGREAGVSCYMQVTVGKSVGNM